MKTNTSRAKKVLVALFAMLMPLLASAYDFEKDGFYYGITSLQDLTVELTFGENKYIGDIEVPDKVEYANRVFKVTRLGDECFSSCSSVFSIKLPSSIKTIGSYAFSGCYNLTSLTIPSSIEEIGLGESSTNGKYCFSGCSSLEHIIFEESEESLRLHPNTWTSSSISTFIGCPIKSLYIGRDVWCSPTYSYTDNPFYGKERLTNIVLGALITKIDSHMFENCVGLEKIDIPGNITYIGNSAFKGCSKLKDIYIAEGVQNIQNNAFEDCESIQELVLPASITNISEKAFYNCKDIQNVKVHAVTPSKIHDNAFSLSVYMNSILAVPIGSKTLYENAEGWKNFTNIVESAEDENLNQFQILSITTGLGGRLVIGDNTIYNTSCKFSVKKLDSLVINIAPNKGFHLQSFKINNEDFIAKICNKSITLNPIGDIHNIEAVFCKSPIYQINYVVDGDTIKTDSVAYGEVITIPEEPTKIGHTFNGWTEIPETMPASDITISGTFTINKYIVTFKIGNETIASDTLEYGAKIIQPEAPEKEGYTFDGWKGVAETVPARNLTYRGYYSINSYILTYVLDGDTIQKSSITYGETIIIIDTPIKEGYTFSGWSEFPETMPAEDITISGTFTINKYLITFKIDDEVISVDSLEYNSVIVAPEVPEREGYIFSGWGDIPETMPANDITIEGTFTRLSSIYLSINQADNGCVKQHIVVGTVCTYTIEAAEGWKIHTVTFNGEDVTSQLTEEGTFTTPELQGDAVLNIAYEKIDDAISHAQANRIKVQGHQGIISITGATEGTDISLYTTDGTLVTRETAEDDTTHFTVPTGQVYIVKVADTVVKIGM